MESALFFSVDKYFVNEPFHLSKRLYKERLIGRRNRKGDVHGCGERMDGRLL